MLPIALDIALACGSIIKMITTRARARGRGLLCLFSLLAGGRIVKALATNGFVTEARAALKPMVQRVCENKDFREWYGQANNPSGSTRFHGSAGELARAIKLLRSLPSD
jgi:hypothetical protein